MSLEWKMIFIFGALMGKEGQTAKTIKVSQSTKKSVGVATDKLLGDIIDKAANAMPSFMPIDERIAVISASMLEMEPKRPCRSKTMC